MSETSGVLRLHRALPQQPSLTNSDGSAPLCPVSAARSGPELVTATSPLQVYAILGGSGWSVPSVLPAISQKPCLATPYAAPPDLGSRE
jgi:hypothetical protein